MTESDRKKRKRCNCELYPSTTKATKKKDGGIQRRKECKNCGNTYLTFTAPNCLEARVESKRTNPNAISPRLIKAIAEGKKEICTVAKEINANYRTLRKAVDKYKEGKK